MTPQSTVKTVLYADLEYFFFIFVYLVALNVTDFGKTDEHARAVVVAQAPLDVLIFIHLRRNGIVAHEIAAHPIDIFL